MAEVRPLRAKRVTDDAPPVTPEAYAAAARGEVFTTLQAVPGHKAKKALGVAVADVPIERFWAAINDESSKVEWTRLDYLEILEGENCRDNRMVMQFLPVTMVSDRWWVLRQDMNEELMAASEGRVREVRWSSVKEYPTTPTAKVWMEKGIPIAYTHGSWFLVELDSGHTLIEYYTWTDPGGAIPAGIASSFASGTIADTIETMSRLAAAGPRCLE